MAHKEEEVERCVHEGRIDGLFKGFKNRDTIFKIRGCGCWRQAEYVCEYHHLDSPKARIIGIMDKKLRIEFFYIEIEGIKTRVKVLRHYV